MKTPFAFMKGGGPPPFNLQSLDWELFFHFDDYSYTTPGGTPLGTITGRTTAGISDTFYADAVSTGAPTVGTPLGGKGTIDLNRASTQILPVKNVSGGSQTSPVNPVPSGDYTFFCLHNFNNTGAPNNAPTTSYDNETLIGDHGGNRFIQAVRPGKVIAYQYDGGFKAQEAAATDGTWQLVISRYKVSTHTLEVREGSGTWIPLTSVNAVVVGGGLTIGQSTNSGQGFFGSMAVLALSTTWYDDATVANIIAGVNAEWGQSF